MSVKIFILRRLLKYASPIISVFEQRRINKYSDKQPDFQPVFIVGPPRSGSTILFQVLTNYLDVCYITNIVNLAKKNPFFGFFLNEKFSKKRAHNTFSSSYGKTKEDNFLAPNEGLFWYKWLRKGEYYSDETSLNAIQKNQFKKTIFAITNKYNKPFLIKNLSFSVRIKLLLDVFPNAKYIYIKRNPVFVSQSIILAKQKLNIPVDEMWSVRPQNFSEFEKLGLIKQVSRQVKEIENHINEDKKSINPDNFIEISYENLCNKTNETVSLLGTFIGAKNRMNCNIKNLNIKDTVKLEQLLFDELKSEINKIYNNNEQ